MNQDASSQLIPIRDHWSVVAGRRVYARMLADSVRPGPPLVLVHGFMISGVYMLPVARCLVPQFSVAIPDLPGFGNSDHPKAILDVPALADALVA